VSPIALLLGCIAAGAPAVLAQDASATTPAATAPDSTPTAPAAAAAPDSASDEQTEEQAGIHGQFTNIWQWHPAFHSPYSGPQSLNSGSRGDETVSLSLFFGWRPWQGAELYVTPELFQGFGLSNTNGIADFPNGEAFKVGTRTPVGQIIFARPWTGIAGRCALGPPASETGGAPSASAFRCA
jgi:high affinity Mn2+ porin